MTRTVDGVDAVVVGAGVIGLACARALALEGARTLVLEREDRFGSATSARNSEVIHAGIHYPPGSLKARLCVAGRDRLYDFCAERGVAHGRPGKLIVATSEAERAALEAMRVRARAAGAGDLEPLDAADVAALEPEVRAVAGLFSPRTGILDSHAFMLALLADIEAREGVLVCRTEVRAVRMRSDGFDVETGGADAGRVRCRILVNASGLEAQAVAARCEGFPEARIPRRYLARGRYFVHSGAHPFRHLVYPVPVAGGLGVHATLDLGGGLRFGPDVEWIDEIDYAFDASALDAFVGSIRRWFPGLDPQRLTPGHVGIRPKIVGPGEPAADFRIDCPASHGVDGLVHLFGIESPGLTASLALADEVVGRVA